MTTMIQKSDLISRQEAIDAIEHITSSMSVCVNSDECHGMKRMQRQAVLELANMPSAQPDIWTDGTLHITVDADISQISRVLVSQKGTQYGNMYYADAEPKWIPCSERLPEDNQSVLMTI